MKVRLHPSGWQSVPTVPPTYVSDTVALPYSFAGLVFRSRGDSVLVPITPFRFCVFSEPSEPADIILPTPSMHWADHQSHYSPVVATRIGEAKVPGPEMQVTQPAWARCD